MQQTEKIWLEYHQKLLGFIRSRINDASIAEDILQEIFIKVFTRIDTLNEQTKVESWLYQITRNTVYDYYRSHKPNEALPEGLAQPDLVDSDQAKLELESCLEPMINQLSDKYRDTVYLSEIKGLNQSQVAEQQNISYTCAKSRIQRGRHLLKGLLYECCEFELDKKNRLIDFKSKGTDC